MSYKINEYLIKNKDPKGIVQKKTEGIFGGKYNVFFN
jgi:hypothetical protein